MGPAPSEQLSRQLTTCGFRFTPQRQQVYSVLLQKRDHPTAEEVFIRAKRQMPEISLATVYNCLEALVQSGLARQLTLDRGAARFCPNMAEHCHFYCDGCGKIFDIDLPTVATLGLEETFKVERVEMTVHGRCPECATADRPARVRGRTTANLTT